MYLGFNAFKDIDITRFEYFHGPAVALLTMEELHCVSQGNFDDTWFLLESEPGGWSSFNSRSLLLKSLFIGYVICRFHEAVYRTGRLSTGPTHEVAESVPIEDSLIFEQDM